MRNPRSATGTNLMMEIYPIMNSDSPPARKSEEGPQEGPHHPGPGPTLSRSSLGSDDLEQGSSYQTAVLFKSYFFFLNSSSSTPTVMETSQLILILSAIVFCFLFQTFILKSRMTESLTSVEDTLQKTHHQMELLSEERLDRVSGIIEESGKSFAETMQDVPSVISHLKQVHATQKIYEEKLLHVLTKLEKYENESDPKATIGEVTFSKLIDELAAKMNEDRKLTQDYCQKIDNPMFINVSYRQFLWFVLGILVLTTIQGFFKVEYGNDVKGYTVLAAFLSLNVIVILVISYII